MLNRNTRQHCAVIALWLFGTAANGDVSLRKPEPHVARLVRLEGIEQYPEMFFYLRYRTMRDGLANDRWHVSTVYGGSGTLSIGGAKPIFDLELVAINLKEFQKRGEDWLRNYQNGAISVSLEPPAVTTHPTQRETITRYQVKLDNGQMTVSTHIFPEPRTSRFNETSVWVAGTAISLGLAFCGVWCARRMKSR